MAELLKGKLRKTPSLISHTFKQPAEKNTKHNLPKEVISDKTTAQYSIKSVKFRAEQNQI